MRSAFLSGDLFDGQTVEVEDGPEQNRRQGKEKGTQLSNKNEKLCPICGKPGSGPYARWVRNSVGKKYEPYFYFAHRVNGKISWCYIPRDQYKKSCEKEFEESQDG